MNLKPTDQNNNFFGKNSPVLALSECADTKESSLEEKLCILGVKNSDISLLKKVQDRWREENCRSLFSQEEKETLSNLNLKLDIPISYYVTEENDKDTLRKLILTENENVILPRIIDKLSPIEEMEKGCNLKIMKWMIKKSGDDSKAINIFMLCACSLGNLEVVKYLVKEGADLSFEHEGKTALLLSCVQGHLNVVRYLVEEKKIQLISIPKEFPFPHGMKGNILEEALLQACAGGHLDIVKYFIEEIKMDPNLKNGWGLSPVMYVCAKISEQDECQFRLNVLKYLVEECKVDCDVRDIGGYTPLMNACRNLNLQFVKYLVENTNVDVNAVSIIGSTALSWSFAMSKFDIVDYLVREEKVDISIEDMNGNTILMSACGEGRVDLVKYLIEERKADVGVRNAGDEDILSCAWRKGRMDVVKYLIEEGVKIKVKHK